MIKHNNTKIKKVEQNGDKLEITVEGRRKPYEIPALIGGKPVPLTDPYDTKTGNGFMVQNAILDSDLSPSAKLLYCSLRKNLYYGTGYSFVNASTLAKCMSVTTRTVTTAIKELVRFNVIAVELSDYDKKKKNYYALLPREEWRLPTKEEAKAFKKELRKPKSQDREQVPGNSSQTQ